MICIFKIQNNENSLKIQKKKEILWDKVIVQESILMCNLIGIFTIKNCKLKKIKQYKSNCNSIHSKYM